METEVKLSTKWVDDMLAHIVTRGRKWRPAIIQLEIILFSLLLLVSVLYPVAIGPAAVGCAVWFKAGNYKKHASLIWLGNRRSGQLILLPGT